MTGVTPNIGAAEGATTVLVAGINFTPSPRLVFAEPWAIAAFAITAAAFERVGPAGAVIPAGQAVQTSAFGAELVYAPLLSRYLFAAQAETKEHCAPLV